MYEGGTDNVLLVWGGGDGVSEVLRNMFDDGLSVIGPATTASIAMTLAAQSAPTIAVIARPPVGRRDSIQLADELFRTWGVRTWVAPGAYDGDTAETAEWSASDAKIERMRRALLLGSRQDSDVEG